MVTGMATRKVTVTLEEVQLDQIRALVQARTAPSVSGLVQHAVALALDDVVGWGAMLAEALRQTGPLSGDERAWADDVLGTSTRRRRTDVPVLAGNVRPRSRRPSSNRLTRSRSSGGWPSASQHDGLVRGSWGSSMSSAEYSRR
jgi:hypothetical protein